MQVLRGVLLSVFRPVTRSEIKAWAWTEAVWLPIWKIMNYIFAILLPPLAIVFTGRPFLGVVVFLFWIPALIFSGGLSHPMFILLAWFLIFQSNTKAER